MQAQQVGSCAQVPLNVSLPQLNITTQLASGVEGAVYQGSWQGRSVAVKRYRIAQSDDLVRFRRELAIMASLQHHNIMPILGELRAPNQQQHTPRNNASCGVHCERCALS